MTDSEERIAFTQGHLPMALATIAGKSGENVDPAAIVLFVIDLGDSLGKMIATALEVDIERAEAQHAKPGKPLAVFVGVPLENAIALLRTFEQPKIAHGLETLPLPPGALRVIGITRRGATLIGARLPPKPASA